VAYVPVPYRARIGRSKFHPLRDTFLYLRAIVVVTAVFRPLRIVVLCVAVASPIALLAVVAGAFARPILYAALAAISGVGVAGIWVAAAVRRLRRARRLSAGIEFGQPD
jgi:hypothetical protein